MSSILEDEKKLLGIYIHIPFCVRKCNYCDFLSAPADEETKAAYVSRLIEEISGFENAADYVADSIFIGGGTPSILKGEQIREILKTVKEVFVLTDDCEITIECNPGTLDEEKAAAFLESGINRISFGLQSCSNEKLQILGRIHTYEDFCKSFSIARKAGFSNINVDLMSGLPGQTANDWKKDLEQVIALGPEHISAYSLIIEEGTPFFDRYSGEGNKENAAAWPELPEEETEAQIDAQTRTILDENGYGRYEISNYCRPGYECRHNVKYWYRGDYAGFGIGAASLYDPIRCRTGNDLSSYINGDFSKDEFVVLTKDNQIEETMYLGLRTVRGISTDAFEKTFRCKVHQVYPSELKTLKEQGLIREEDGYLFLTERGMEMSNPVLSRFLLD